MEILMKFPEKHPNFSYYIPKGSIRNLVIVPQLTQSRSQNLGGELSECMIKVEYKRSK